VRSLIEAGTNVNASTFHGGTPIFVAAMNGNHEILSMLIAAGANMNAAYKVKVEGGLPAASLPAFAPAAPGIA
jgi:ankyrin repeat protein